MNLQHTCIKKKQQQKNNYFADISAVQILKCINALVVFIDYIKRYKTHYEYKSTVHVHVKV